MIQRIQSIYLLGASLFMLLFYMFPIAVFTTDIWAYEFFNCHITHPENLQPPLTLMPLAVLPFLSLLLSFISIFMFKKRKLQRRLGKLNMLNIGVILMLEVFYFIKIGNLLDGEMKLGFSGIFPVIAFVLIFLANRAIKHDDDLVRAADRIR